MSGTLLIVGGGSSKSEDEIMTILIRKAGGPKAKIALIVTASGDHPDELHREYQADLEKLGLPSENLILVPLYAQYVRDERGYNAMTGDADGLLDCMEGVTGVWFSGGDQYHTNQCLVRPDGSDTKLLAHLRKIYEDGGVIGGSSAGAAIMSRVMIGDGNNCGVLGRPVMFGYDGYAAVETEDDPSMPLIIAQGLGFFTHGIIDQHFNRRPRFMRLIETCFANSEGMRVGYGISEDTAIVYSNGKATFAGSASVYMFDCREAEKTGNGCYRGIHFAGLQKGDSIDFETGEITFAWEKSPKEEYFYPNYVSDGVVNGPYFDRMMDRMVLRGREDCLYTDAEGRKYIKGAAVYAAGEDTYVTAVKYTRTPGMRGYRGNRTSFAGVDMDVVSVKVEGIDL